MKDVMLLQAALSYANRGWHVFPLQPRSKVPATHHGVKDATTDVDRIQNWWTDNTEYNVGIACGKASNIFVIDEDNKDATDPIYVPKATLMASTGGGGRHYVFAYQGAEGLGNTVRKIAGNIDTRSDDGYIVAPPSIHPNGTPYAWINDLDVTPMPPEYRAIIDARLKHPQVTSCCPLEMVIREGTRNDTLYRKACSLRSQGLSKSELLAVIGAINENRCSPPLPHRDVETIVEQAIKHPAGWLVRELTESDPLNNADNDDWFKPIRGSDIVAPKKPEWIWENYIAKGRATLFASDWKRGKTSLLFNVLKHMREGGHLVTAITKGTALIISEEIDQDWAARDVAEWGEHVEFVFRPFTQWERLIRRITRHVDEHHPDVVVIDTFASFSGVEDENSSAKMLAALRAADVLLTQNVAVVMLHHNRKSGGEYGSGARGSSAFGGKVDIVCNLTTYGNVEDTRRKLQLISRLSSAHTVVLDYDPKEKTYWHVSQSDVDMETNIKWTMSVAAEPPGFTAQEIVAHWQYGERPADKTARDKLLDLYRNKTIGRTGEGSKTSPYRYHRIVP